MNRLFAFLSCALAVIGAFGAPCGEAYALGYPVKPIRLLVGYAAGGGADALARLTAIQLSESLGQ